MENLQRVYSVATVIIDAFHLEIRCTQTHQTLAVPQKPFEVLNYLIAHHPRLVTRDELIQHVWDGNIYVGDKALTNAIWQLRTLFEQLGLRDFIQTVRKRGYRLEISPEVITEERPTATPEDVATKTQTTPTAAAVKIKQEKPTLFWLSLIITSLAILFSFIWWLQPTPTQPMPIAAEEIPTLGAGRAQFASVSPDNRHLVYVWRSFTGSSNLFVQEIAAPDNRYQLTFSDLRESRPQWDHTGRYILFIRQHPYHGDCAIMRVDLMTKLEEQLASCRSSGTNYLAAHPHRDEYYFNGPTLNNSNLYRLNLAEQQVSIESIPCTALAYCDFPIRDLAVSPDGQYLALTRRANRLSEDLYVLDLTTLEERQLTKRVVDIIGISWHTNSEDIIMAAAESGQRAGYLVNIHNRKKTPLGIDNFGSPSQVSPDGYVYYHSIESRMQLSYLALNANAPSALFPITMSDYQYRNPHLNPMTGEFVFVSNRSDSDELWLAEPSFKNMRQLTNLGSVVRYPRWSHDGKRLAFVARFPLENKDVLTLLDLETERIHRLYEFELVLGRPTWWHDDSKLIVREKGNLHLFDLTTLTMTQLTHNGGIFAQSRPDGQLYFTKGTNQGLWLRTPEGKEELIVAADIFGTRYSWVVVEGGVYFYQLSEQGDHLSFYDFNQQSLQKLLSIPPELMSPQSSLAYDAANNHLVLESWQARSKIMRTQHPLLQPL